MEIGTDINSNWELVNGDLSLVSEEQNLAQSVINRLNCVYESLNLFYADYGSNLFGILGWKHNDKVLDFIRLEINNSLKQDPRFRDFEINISYIKTGEIKIELNVWINDEETELNFVLNEYEGVSIGSE